MAVNKTASLLVLLIGAGLLAVSLLADVIGVGDDPGFGPQQTKGSIAGGAILLLGLILVLRGGGDDSPSA